MKIKLKYFYPTLSLGLLFSCEPARDTNGDYLNGLLPSQTVVSQLVRTNSVQTDTESGMPLLQDITYMYQNGKLAVLEVKNSGRKTLTYNADNKISEIKGGGENSIFTYAGAQLGKIVTDSSTAVKTTATFEYAAGIPTKIITIRENMLPPASKSYRETTLLFSGANVSQAVTKEGIYLADGTQQMQRENTFTYTYDTKKTPWKLLPAELLLHWAGVYGAPYRLSANNRVVQKVSGSSTSETAFTYRYNDQGYPLEARSATGSFITFEYK